MFDSKLLLELPVLITLTILLVASWVIEFRTRRIPNKLLLLGLLAGIGLAVWHHSWQGSLWGIGVGLAAWHFGFAGGGFAKLIIVVGLIGGPLIPITSAVLSVLFYISVEAHNAAQSPQERVDKPRNTAVIGTPMVALAMLASVSIAWVLH